jgi:hypothetical protein
MNIDEATAAVDAAYERYGPTQASWLVRIGCALILHSGAGQTGYSAYFDDGYVRIEWCDRCGASF